MNISQNHPYYIIRTIENFVDGPDVLFVNNGSNFIEGSSKITVVHFNGKYKVLVGVGNILHRNILLSILNQDIINCIKQQNIRGCHYEFKDNILFLYGSSIDFGQIEHKIVLEILQHKFPNIFIYIMDKGDEYVELVLQKFDLKQLTNVQKQAFLDYFQGLNFIYFNSQVEQKLQKEFDRIKSSKTKVILESTMEDIKSSIDDEGFLDNLLELIEKYPPPELEKEYLDSISEIEEKEYLETDITDQIVLPEINKIFEKLGLKRDENIELFDRLYLVLGNIEKKTISKIMEKMLYDSYEQLNNEYLQKKDSLQKCIDKIGYYDKNKSALLCDYKEKMNINTLDELVEKIKNKYSLHNLGNLIDILLHLVNSKELNIVELIEEMGEGSYKELNINLGNISQKLEEYKEKHEYYKNNLAELLLDYMEKKNIDLEQIISVFESTIMSLKQTQINILRSKKRSGTKSKGKKHIDRAKLYYSELIEKIKYKYGKRILKDYFNIERKKGLDKYLCPCPFHQESSSSFVFYLDSMSGYCYGCQACGDIIDLYCRINGLSIKEALTSIIQQYNIDIKELLKYI